MAESRAGGLLSREPARIVQELLEFGDLTAGEVVVPRTQVIAFPLGADRSRVAAAVETERHTRFPVYDGSLDNIVGIVHVKDLLARLGRDGNVERSLLRSVPFVPATEPLDRVLTTLPRRHEAFAVDPTGSAACYRRGLVP